MLEFVSRALTFTGLNFRPPVPNELHAPKVSGPHFVLDRMNGWCGLHLNLGCTPDIFVETVTEGARLLKPFMPADQWVPDHGFVRALLGMAMESIFRSPLIPNRTEVCLYSPFIDTNGGPTWNEMLADRIKVRGLESRELIVRSIFAGPTVKLESSNGHLSAQIPPFAELTFTPGDYQK